MKPVTYMNLSGEAVGQAARFYKIPPERVLVISDDVSLPLGKLRIRKSGSAGGHNGLKNIIQHLGTDQFPRVKIGVGEKPHPDYDMADWVLSRFTGEDLKTITQAVKRAADAVECFVREGPDKAMNRFKRVGADIVRPFVPRPPYMAALQVQAHVVRRAGVHTGRRRPLCLPPEGKAACGPLCP